MIIPLLAVVPMFAAIGYSLVYLLAGGGFCGRDGERAIKARER